MAYIYYVDGSCSNNGNFPNEGGFSVVKVDPSTGEVVDHYAKRSVNTTNNREELKAILWVMLNHGHENPIVYSDSAYSVNTYTTWMFGWARRGWLKADKKPPENLGGDYFGLCFLTPALSGSSSEGQDSLFQNHPISAMRTPSVLYLIFICIHNI